MGLFGKFGGKGKNNKPNDAEQEVQETHADEKPNKGLFGKGKAKKEKAKDKPKVKKSLFGGKKKEMTLVERMQLEESVAAASLDVVQELAELGNSAVREVDDGFLIVAITNEMLEEVGLDPSSEEFGSFAEALRSETIESIALAEDLADGVIGIIPSQETLISLDEYDFIHELNFKWALVPFDLDDEDRLILLETDVSIEQLVELANNPSIELTVENSEVIEIGAEDDEYDFEGDSYDEGVDEYDDFDGGVEDDDDDELELGIEDDEDEPALEVDDSFDDNEFDSFDDNEFADDDFDSGFDDSFDDELDLGDDFDSDLDDDFGSFDEGVDDAEQYASATIEEELMSPEETKEAINRVAEHTFNNAELDLKIDMTIFDDYFDSVSIARFDTSKTDDSELQKVIAKLREDANVELQRFHQENIQSLRNKYITSMREIHNKLVESLDHKNENTTYGAKFYEIETQYEDALDDIDRVVANEVEKIHQEYNREREEFAENARREALAVFDSRYKDARDRKIASLKDVVQADIKIKRDTEIGELYKDRRTVAQRLFDKATTALLQKLQEEYQQIAQKELAMYDAFRKDMDTYLRKHFADEVLRAKAEAEKLRQSHEAERVRQEYEQILLAKTIQLEEADARAKENLRQLEQSHKDEIKQIKADFERRLEREQRENKSLREMLQDANENTARITEQKEKEIEHRMKLYEDRIKAQELELQYANQRAKESQKPLKFIVGAAVAIGIALGIIFGFIYGASQSQHIAPGAPETQAMDGESYGYHLEYNDTDTFHHIVISEDNVA